MDNRPLTEAIYRLGQLSCDPDMTNGLLLRRMVEVAAETLGSDIAGVAVYEQGLQFPATACYVHGPWTRNESQRFLNQSQWEIDDRVLAQRLVKLPTGRMYQRSELIDDREFKASRLYNEFQRPMRLGDQALGIFRRTDGVELLVGVNALDASGRIPRETLARANALAPYMAQCWARAWRTEPRWMTDLKPKGRRVLEHVLEGFDDDQIADLTGLTYHSVRAHLKRLFRQAGVRSRLHLMQMCRQDRAMHLEASPVDAPKPLVIDDLRAAPRLAAS